MVPVIGVVLRNVHRQLNRWERFAADAVCGYWRVRWGGSALLVACVTRTASQFAPMDLITTMSNHLSGKSDRRVISGRAR